MIIMEKTQVSNINNPADRATKKILALAGLTIALILALLFGLYKLPADTYISNLDTNLNHLSLASDVLYPLEENNASKLHSFTNEHNLLGNNDFVSYISINGISEIDIPIETSAPFSVLSDNFALVVDLNAFNYYLFDHDGLLFRGRTEAPILLAEVSNAGHFTFILDEPDTKGMLSLFSVDGSHILDYELRERLSSGFPIDLEFTPDATKLFINIINLDSIEIITHIHTIDLEKLEFNYNNNFWSGSSLINMDASTDNYLTLANSETFIISDFRETNYKIEFSDISEFYADEFGVSIIASLNEGDAPALFFIDYEDLLSSETDSPVGPINIGDKPGAIIANAANIVVAADNGLYIVSKRNPDNTYFHELGDFDILSMVFLNDNQIMLICSDGVRAISI